MGQPAHLEFEVLSALADGELDPVQRRPAMEHLAGCRACLTAYEQIAAVDGLLREPTPISCAAAQPLLSAALDHEADLAEIAVARAHAATCASCAGAARVWSSADLQLRALPLVAPSARVDRAIAELALRGQRPAGLRVGLPQLVIAGATGALLLIGSLYRAVPANGPLGSTAESPVLVAAVQQVVYNARTNTVYVLDAPAAAVDARDATTNEVKVRIDVGGRPTALALNASAQTVLVLDSSQKKLTEIDASSNTIRGSSTVATVGTPATITVDPSSSKIVVTSTTTTSGAASVAILDSTTKAVETVRDVEVGAVAMVFDSSGDRALLVSPSQTTVVDSDYKIITTLPGGVAASFGQGDERIAVLSASGTKTIVTYAGPRAPIPLELPGTPRAITALPDGGFLVLVELGGKSRVSHVAPDGHEIGNTEVAALGQDLIYDAKTRKFSVLGRSGVVSGDVPTGALAAASATAAPTSGAPSATTDPSASAPASSESPSPSPSPSSTPATVAVAPSTAKSFEHVDLPGERAPVLVSKSGESLWVLDDRNGVVSIDIDSGHMDFISLLPRSAQISFWAAGRDYVYGVDARKGELHVVDRATGRVSSYAMHFLKPVSSVAVAPDDRLWIGLSEVSYLLAFDPHTARMDTFDLGTARVSKLAVDTFGRVIYADDAGSLLGTYDPRSARASELRFARNGATTSLVVDRDGTVWLATSAGQIYSVRNGTPRLALAMPRPVTTLSLDVIGRAWYLAPLPSGLLGFGYATADGVQLGGTIGEPASSLDFSVLGRAWLADPKGGFFVSRSEK